MTPELNMLLRSLFFSGLDIGYDKSEDLRCNIEEGLVIEHTPSIRIMEVMRLPCPCSGQGIAADEVITTCRSTTRNCGALIPPGTC